ncbi:MAG: alpha/beta fold hydrolase [Chloroflexota bacterium]
MAEFSEAYVEADGFRIRYREAGRGSPLVTLHGAGGLRVSRSHELLAEHHRVIVFEVPGFGDSPANERSSSLRDLASTMGHAAANLGLDRFSLMGNSFGGKLALWLAVQQPERIESLVLAAPAAIMPAQSIRVPAAERQGLMHAHPERQPAMRPLDPAVRAKQEALINRLGTPPRDEALEALFPNLTMPVLVLFGTLDRVIPPDMGRVYREKLPNCHFMLLYDAAHALDADRPEAFASVVGDFLTRRESFIVNIDSGLINP